MRLNRSFASVLLAAMAFVQALSLPPAAAENWRTYRNERFGTTIAYPDLFQPGLPPANGDGLEFKSTDGAAFSVFGGLNALELDLAGLESFILKNLNPKDTVTYRARGDHWFVISGTKADSVFYQRHLISHGGQIINGFIISYPAALKQKYDPIVARMSKSLRAGTGYQTSGNP